MGAIQETSHRTTNTTRKNGEQAARQFGDDFDLVDVGKREGRSSPRKEKRTIQLEDGGRPVTRANSNRIRAKDRTRMGKEETEGNGWEGWYVRRRSYQP
ncbi:hypothetical protein H4Q26_003984 [Puccinia striiformis f. sp. tritici PST-130]|nr:hypothetical protein H4Q26_003984 [Puccinia striiformis f. sp. tritici PST-130]